MNGENFFKIKSNGSVRHVFCNIPHSTFAEECSHVFSEIVISLYRKNSITNNIFETEVQPFQLELFYSICNKYISICRQMQEDEAWIFEANKFNYEIS